MSQENYISMLRESLQKKVSLLQEIIELNKQQEAILRDPGSSPDEFDENTASKQAIIDQIISMDEGFDQLFERVRDELESNKAKYRDDIEAMKTMIRQITDLSAKVRIQEKANYDLAQKKFSSIKEQAQKVRVSQRAVSKYYQSMGRRLDNYDPQFLDNNG